ncbi:MAG: DUF6622 family protein [Chloroflexota bacterium]
MFAQVVQNTPVWVWPVLGIILGAGALQLRPRTIPATLVVGMPVLMAGLALFGVVSSFGIRVEVIGAWVLGAAIGLVLNEHVLRSPRAARFHPGSERYEVPGSALPLVLMLVIFGARYVVGATTAMAPAVSATLVFIASACSILGLCSGLFVARALRILRSRAAPVPSGAV